jgi:hypothetical protein
MVYRGAGLLQQISPSNRRAYTKLTADILEDFLYNLSYNILGFGERKFMALTGEMGMRELDRVLRENRFVLCNRLRSEFNSRRSVYYLQDVEWC